jgi:hypothetical protein
MKRNILIYLLCITSVAFFVSCSSNNKDNNDISTKLVVNPNTANTNINSDILPKIKFEKKIHDFGKLIQGEKVSYSFKFKNTGNSDLLISYVSPSCSCVKVSYPKIPIHSGKQGIIKVTFDSQGRQGCQKEAITLISNTQPNKMALIIKANVFIP